MVAGWVKDMTEDVFAETLGGRHLEVGDVVQHPDGRAVKIIDGEYWAEGGFSNHWSWREVLKSGKLSRKLEYGYGWRVPV